MQHNYYNELWETYVTDFKEAFTIHKGIIQCGPSENQKMKFFITKWENFAIAERLKFLKYRGVDAKLYFWRTAQMQEIDLIEEHEGGELKAFEFKYNASKKVRFSETFTANYKCSETKVITPANTDAFLLP